MADNTSKYEESKETILYDEDGTVILTVHSAKTTEIGASGEVSEFEREPSVRLPDGFLWAPQMQRWANPVLLTTCSVCRNSPFSLFRRRRASTGLVAIRNARNCVKCGTTVCGAHRRWREEGWLCVSCAGRGTWWGIIRPIFFREETP